MPEDKQKEESMIDVGEQEGAEINLDEQSKGTENETQETKIEVADDNQPASTSEKSDGQSDASAQNNQKEELEKYSDSVKKRINGLTKRMREAERQREEALTFARTMKEQKEKAENRFAHLDKSYMSEFEKRVTSNLDAAKSELKNAIDNGDAEGQVAAQQKIAQLTMDAARLSTLKASQPQEKEGKQVNINPQRTEARSNVQTDPKAEVWAS